MEIRRILLTGGTGFLGAHILFDLLKNGYAVYALRRSSSSCQWTRRIFEYRGDQNESLFKRIVWVDGDVLDYESMYKQLEGIDAVVHAAAIVSFNPMKRKVMIRENQDAAANVVEACLARKVKMLCHISSVAALGAPVQGEVVNESCMLSSFEGKNAYGIAKYRAEMQIRRGSEIGLPVTILNPVIILGPGNWNSGSPKFFSYIANRNPFYTLGGEGFVDVRDVSAMVIESIENPQCLGESFVLCAENLSYKDLFRKIAQALNVRAPYIRPPQFLLGVLALIMERISIWKGMEPAISRDSIGSAKRCSFYDGSKMERLTSLRYRSLDETIEYAAQCYTSLYSSKK
jgi:nucleoside-diphosphate-sugar epimerase